MSKTPSKRLKIVTGVFLGVVCGVVMRSAFSKSDKNAPVLAQPVPAMYAQNNTALQGTATVAAQSLPPAVGEKPNSEVAGKPGTGPDGKEEIPADGKETIPTDGKESLPPVGQYLPNSKPGAVDPGNGDPAIEFQNKTPPNNNANAILGPASPQNIAGPVVSPETR